MELGYGRPSEKTSEARAGYGALLRRPSVNPWDGKWTREGRGYFTAYDVRARTYRGVFAGSCGVTYGHHQIWQFLDTNLNKPVNVGDTLIPWKTALVSEAAGEMQYLKKLMLSRPYFSRIPDQSIVTSHIGENYVDMITATRDKVGSYAMIYLRKTNLLRWTFQSYREKKRISWYNPRTGKIESSKMDSGKGRYLILHRRRDGTGSCSLTMYLKIMDSPEKNGLISPLLEIDAIFYI
jgi:hypothetical protein